MKASKCKCGTPISVEDKLCLKCCREKAPTGPPLKRCRRYGFKVTYRQRQEMNLARDITGAIPTEVDTPSRGVKVSHLFVAVDGKTYIGHEWIESGGGSYSWTERYRKDSQQVSAASQEAKA